MNMLKVHREALAGEQWLYHEFLGRYSRTAKRIYGFVEGKEDPSYYSGAIN